MDNKSPISALNAAMNLLARYAYSEFKLGQKLRSKGYSESEIEHALHFAVEQHWLDDALYAQQLVNKQCSKGYGRNYIKPYLYTKGIPAELAERTLQQAQWDWYQALDVAYLRKYRNQPTLDWQQQRQQRAYLYRRGFDSDLIQTYFSDLKEQSA